MKITKRRLRQIIREELTLERDGVASMSDAERAAVRKELHRQGQEMRRIQTRIEELEPEEDALEARSAAIQEELEQMIPRAEELDAEEARLGPGSVDIAGDYFVGEMEELLEEIDEINEDLSDIVEELADLYSERKRLGISMSVIARAQTP